MLENIVKILASFAMVLTMSVAASAENFSASRNRTTDLFYFANWEGGGGCNHLGKIKSSIRVKPKHGRAEFIWTYVKGPDFPKHCIAKLKGLLLRYTPNPGFTGTDSFDIFYLTNRFTNDPAPKGHRETISVTVK